ncbi:MAG: class I SAM-dependent methyltransferase [Eggerthellaceae bacterium]|jgi:SAM-dependent methyltransferase|nr:class I SAM-dependent methyltransferase [Eggerthellaceae bacterium]MCH4220941.1 class I SAM-dependent methyltransferase [Eggerthellaceae bacterium]
MLFQEKEWTRFHATKPSRNQETYWDRRAAGFARHSGISNYSKEFLDLCQLESDWTVLDVGCGSGSITVNIARQTQHVTGIDISGEMLRLAKSSARSLGLCNVDTIKVPWEGDWRAAGVPQVDLAVESRALLTADLPDALAKLNHYARKRVCLTTVCGDLAYNDRRVIESIGRTLPHPPDYIHVVNCLYDMGITADVHFISSVKHDTYCNREAAKKSMLHMLGNVSEEEDEALESFMNNHLVQWQDGWMKDYERRTDWAFIAWNK